MLMQLPKRKWTSHAPQTQKRSGVCPLSSSRSRASTFSLKPWCSQAERNPACTCSRGQEGMLGHAAALQPGRRRAPVATTKVAEGTTSASEHGPPVS